MTLARYAFLSATMFVAVLGCGSDKAIVPTTELTEEQKQAIKAEDAKVAAEESHGKQKK